jgi:hypothetical protein
VNKNEHGNMLENVEYKRHLNRLPNYIFLHFSLFFVILNSPLLSFEREF